MCGIHAVLSPSPRDFSLPPSLSRALRARGPDHFGQVARQSPAGGWALCLTSTVLALRGDRIACQPLVATGPGSGPGSGSNGGSVLCWNGEAWRVSGRVVEAGENDGEVVMERLLQAATATAKAVVDDDDDDRLCVEGVMEVLRGVEGPFAFVYYDAGAEVLVFGRDRLGRRSLMIKDGEGQELEICSLAGEGEGWREVEADGVYVVRLRGGSKWVVERHEWLQGGKEAADFVSTSPIVGFFGSVIEVGLSSQTYSTGCRSPALAGSIERFLLPMAMAR